VRKEIRCKEKSQEREMTLYSTRVTQFKDTVFRILDTEGTDLTK
jgi:hypothetical protein